MGWGNSVENYSKIFLRYFLTSETIFELLIMFLKVLVHEHSVIRTGLGGTQKCANYALVSLKMLL